MRGSRLAPVALHLVHPPVHRSPILCAAGAPTLESKNQTEKKESVIDCSYPQLASWRFETVDFYYVARSKIENVTEWGRVWH